MSEKLNKKELKKAFDENLISEEQYKQELFTLETSPREFKRKAFRLPKSIRPEEFIKLVKQIPDEDKITKIAFLLAYASGLRISEVLALKPEHISDKRITIVQGKYSKDRIVPLPKGWKEYMNSLLPLRTTDRTLQRKFKKHSKKANLDINYTFHSLRHGFATRLLESGVPISHVQSLLGHSNLATTSLYTKARPEDALKSYEELF